MRAKVHITQKRDFTWIIILILIAVPLILEFAIGENLYNNSHESIVSAQKFMSDTFGLKLYESIEEYKLLPNQNENENEKNKTVNMNIFDSFINEEVYENKNPENTEIDLGSTKDIFTSEIIHLINSNSFYLILCALLYNFVNIYKVFILSMTVFSANYVSTTLSYIFHSPKPYMAFYRIKSAVIFNEWGSPNNQLVVLISFGLSLYKVLTHNKYMEKKIFAKIILIIFLIGYAFIDIFLLFASGNCTYNQIIISLFMAVVIFMVIFYSFKVDLNKPKQFYDFIKFNLLYYLTINALLFVFQIILVIFMSNDGDEQYYKRNGENQVNRMPSNGFTKQFCAYRKMFFLDKGNLCNAFCFLMNIIAFLSLKADLHFIYEDNYNSWSEGNFEKPKIEAFANLDQSGQAEEYSHIDESQWNHMGGCINTIRFIFLFIIVLAIFALFIWINSWFDNEIYSYIFLIIIPMILHVFGIFYFYKAVLNRLKLTRPPKIKSKKLLTY